MVVAAECLFRSSLISKQIPLDSITGHSINTTDALRDVTYDNQYKSIYNFCIVSPYLCAKASTFRQILYNQRAVFTSTI